METDRVREYLRYCAKVAEYEELLDHAKGQRDHFAAKVMEEMIESGVPRVTVDGRTVYQERKWHGRKDKERDMLELVEAFAIINQSHMITETVNAQKLDAWIREHVEALEAASPDPVTPDKVAQALPPEVRDLIVVSEVYSLRNRKA